MKRNMKRKTVFSLAAAIMYLFAVLGGGIRVSAETMAYTSQTYENVDERYVTDAEELRTEITGDFQITSEDGKGFSSSGNTYTITAGGEYTLTGVLDGSVIVDAVEEEVSLVLAGCRINSDQAAPITVVSADKVSISAQADTFNEIIDAREPEEETTETTEEVLDPKKAKAAIYSVCDLTIKGHGVLLVTASYNNGIASKDDLKVKNLTLKVDAYHCGLKGNDSVTLEGGEILIIAATGDGIKTENSSLSEKGNQKGNITITGSFVNIYAGKDGISAAYDVELAEEGYVGIYTDTYSNYTQEGTRKSTSTFYLIFSTSDYNTGLDYYAYYSKSGTGEGVFVKTGEVIGVSGGRTTYYGLTIQAPSGYDQVTFASYESGVTPTTENFKSATESININKEMNAYLITSVSGSSMSGDWVSLTTSSSGKSGQEYSTKGIKSKNEIVIGGEVTLVICSTDDAIHATAGTELENGEKGSGVVTINGGTLQLTTKDDGVHADEEINLNGGLLIVTTSYEGIEANQINVNGGQTFVYATDDAVNACGSTLYSKTPCVTITGGYLDVTTPSGDTDAIDSNGNILQTGGFVLVKGGSSTGSMMGSVDVDGTITIDGGCMVACGGVCEGPEGENNAYISSSTSLSKGDYELKDASGNVIVAFTLDSNYGGFWVSCSELAAGTTYTLTNGGSSVLEWTQEAGTMGQGNGFGGMGGFGGGGFGGGGMGGGNHRP